MIENISSFAAVLQGHAQRQPERPALRYLPQGEGDGLLLSYGALDQRLRGLAEGLHRHAEPGARVLLILPQSQGYALAVLACLYAGLVAVPTTPPGPHGSAALKALVQDAKPALALADAEVLDATRALLVGLCPVVSLEQISESGRGWHLPPLSQESLALLQYTSGSTAQPKGVMISHGNLLANAAHLTHLTPFSPTERRVGWAPLTHNMGLIGALLQPLFSGGEALLMPPSAFLEQPLRWLELISRFQASLSSGSPFAYELCVQQIVAEAQPALDLASWRTAIVGSEPLQAASRERFVAAFAPYGFRREAFCPSYGLSEATLIVTAWQPNLAETLPLERQGLAHGTASPCRSGEEASVPVVNCGLPPPGLALRIVEPGSHQAVAEGRVGEVWLRGPSVGQGYWHKPEATTATFQASLHPTDEGPFLRTGDLGFLADGCLYLIGRLKDLIIVRGHNHHAADIEATVRASHPLLAARSNAAFGVAGATGEALVVVQEFSGPLSDADADALLATIRQHLSNHHELSAQAIILVQQATLPKTTSGKIMRFACREAFLNGALAELARWEHPVVSGVAADEAASEVEGRLIALCQAAGLAVTHADDFLAAAGLDSLSVVRLNAAIEQGFGVRLPLELFLEELSVGMLATAVERAATRARSPLVPIQPQGDAPPLFAVHGIAGMVVHLYKLGEHLGRGQPFYGLQAAGLDGHQAPLTDIPAMAASYLAAIRTLQPSGPYHLSGFSFGGVIAFEMASQLAALGEQVALLALLDTHPRTLPPAPAAPFDQHLRQRLRAFPSYLLTLPWPAPFRTPLLQGVERHVRRTAMRLPLFRREFQIKMPDHVLAVTDANLIALHRYRPRPYADGSRSLPLPTLSYGGNGPFGPQRSSTSSCRGATSR